MRVRVLPPGPFSRRGGRSSTARALDCGSSDVGSTPIDHTNWRVGRVRLIAAVPKTARALASPPGFKSQTLLHQTRQQSLEGRFLRCPTTHRPIPFEVMSKRRRGFPSESNVKRGRRVVHGDKELEEKLGRRDLCPCGSGRRFQQVLHAHGPLSTAAGGSTTSATEVRTPS